MSNFKKTIEEIGEQFEGTVLFENPDYCNAIVGHTENGRIVYDYDEMVKHVVENNGVSELDAMSFVDNNIKFLNYNGEKRPIVLKSFSKFNVGNDIVNFLNESEDFQGVGLFVNPNYESAIIGFDGEDDNKLIYSYDLIVEHLMINDGMSMEEAIDFTDYNIVRTVPYMGEKKPIIVYSFPEYLL